MKRFLFYFLLFSILFGCKNQLEISGQLEIPDAIFKYTAEGEGIPCVVFTGSENIGHKLYPPELLEHFILIHADPSKIEDDLINDLSLEGIIDDIEKVRKSLGIKKIAVMGHSMFGPLPLEYASKYSENISFAISTGATPYCTEKYFTAAQEYWESEASEERKNILKENIVRLEAEDMSNFSESLTFIKQYTAYTPYRFYDPYFDMTELWEGIEINMNFLNHFWGKLMKDFNNTDNYKNIQSPVLIIAGKYDFGAPYYLWDDLKNIIPDFTLKVYENAGHNPMLEIPKEFTKTIVEWIESEEN